MIDPYIDPSSGVLINKIGITNQAELDKAEADLVALRSVLLQRNPINGNFDSAHLKEIHRYLFQDIYPFAGSFRTIDLHKADFLSGEKLITSFTPHAEVAAHLELLFQDLATDNFLQNLSRKDFSAKVAALFSAINKAHPFREGNGRAQRHFVRQLSDGVGYSLRWEAITKERLIQASTTSARGDIAPMERLMDEITNIERIQPVLTVIELLDRQNYNWNDRYIASTTPGQHYEGKFVATNGKNFFFYDSDQRILVGNRRDLVCVPEAGEHISFTAS
jgi:cell filamentation protein